MGLPRASGKRRWSGDDNADEVPTKVICTSPPHALCAEDVLHHPALIHAHASTPAIECELTTPVDSSDASDASTRIPEDEQDSSSSSSSASSGATALQHDDVPDVQDDAAFITESEDDSMDEHEDFIDDEEDKDSGFIDSNSIDNSSDDEVESRVISDLPVSTSSSSLSPSSSSLTTVTASSTTTTISSPSSTPHVSSSLQLSLSRVLPSSSSSSTSSTSVTSSLPSPSPHVILTPTPPPSPSPSPPSPSPSPPSSSPSSTSSSTTTIFTSSSTPPTSSDYLVSNLTTCSTTTTTSVCSSGLVVVGGEERLSATMVSDGSVTTVTATQTGTVVTSAYQGALTSPAYDPHSYPYPPESYPARPSTPAWGSCNFYDGSQPHTNKYMEISPSKSGVGSVNGGANQSIQCDENGKSYLELGSASPYTHTYSSECGNYTTSPSSYPSQTYNQTYTSPSTYGQPGTYYNSRQSYSPNPYNVYPSSDGYGAFEGETGCGYGYGVSGYGGARGTLPPARGPQRCMSPYCDPTRGAARPSCYHQQRLSVLNVSMYKLNRFRQFPEPNLHRSVLICNTLRHIERELEAEGVSVASLLAHSHTHGAHPHLQGAAPSGVAPCPEPMPSSPPPVSPTPSEGPLPPMHSQLVGSPLAAPVSLPPSTPVTPPPPPPPVSHFSTAGPTVPQYPSTQYLPADHQTTYDGRETAHLRPYQPLPASTHHSSSDESPPAGPEESEDAEGPPPSPTIRSSPMPTEERTDAINWCSVLSLSSQTDLDSMNNNEYGDWGGEGSADLADYGRADDAPPWKLPSLSADDVLKSFPEASKRLEANEDLDSIINVLVGS